MRVFYKEGGWSSKVNFIDDNNVLVGFDNSDDCCAQGGWFLSDKPSEWLNESFKEEAMDLPGWNFDPDYFKEHGLPGKSKYEEGDSVQFRLVSGEQEKFLTLYNFHNGYYSRGFTLQFGDETKKQGSV